MADEDRLFKEALAEVQPDMRTVFAMGYEMSKHGVESAVQFIKADESLQAIMMRRAALITATLGTALMSAANGMTEGLELLTKTAREVAKLQSQTMSMRTGRTSAIERGEVSSVPFVARAMDELGMKTIPPPPGVAPDGKIKTYMGYTVGIDDGPLDEVSAASVRSVLETMGRKPHGHVKPGHEQRGEQAADADDGRGGGI